MATVLAKLAIVVSVSLALFAGHGAALAGEALPPDTPHASSTHLFLPIVSSSVHMEASMLESVRSGSVFAGSVLNAHEFDCAYSAQGELLCWGWQPREDR